MSDAHHENEEQFYTVNPGESDPSAWSTFVVGVVGLLLAAVIVMLLEVVYHKTAKREFEEKIVKAVPAELYQLRADQLQQLAGSDQGGTAVVPIEQAMQRVVERRGGPAGGSAE